MPVTWYLRVCLTYFIASKLDLVFVVLSATDHTHWSANEHHAKQGISGLSMHTKYRPGERAQPKQVGATHIAAAMKKHSTRVRP